jgi:hypothetical protein
MHANEHNFYGDSPDSVIEAVRNFRAENSLPLGDIEHEMAEQYAVIAPWLVYDVPDHTPPMRSTVSQWVMLYWRRIPASHGIFTDIPATRQAECLKCPHFTHDIGEPADRYDRVAAGRASVIAGQPDWHVHGVCRHHGWPVLIASRMVEPERLATPHAPENCWVNQPQNVHTV